MANGPLVAETLYDGVVAVRMKYKGGWQQEILFAADHHFDNPHTDVAMIKRHLEEVKARKTGCFFLGDFFCAMQGRKDRRHRKGDIKQKHLVDNYYDALVDDAVEFLSPYAHNILGMGYGNHETSIIDHMETDLIARTITRLNEKTGSSIQRLGYAGWIQLRFEHESGGCSKVVNVAYTHGYGGEAPKTKGVLQTSGRAVMLPDANVIFSGHIHQSFLVEDVRDRISTRGRPYKETLLHVQLPTYKDEYDQANGMSWHRQNGKTPRPQGAWWLSLQYNMVPAYEGRRHAIQYSARRAL